MTCKDCIYEPRCIGVISWCMDVDDNTGEILCDMEKRCKHFKDKSLFVQQPCKEGDMVYTFYSCSEYIVGRYGKKRKSNCMIYALSSRGRSSYGYLYDFTNIEIRKIAYKNSYKNRLGKTVFLTYAEAERALQEYRQKQALKEQSK